LATTAGHHVGGILSKLDMHSRSAAVARTHEFGLAWAGADVPDVGGHESRSQGG